MDSWRTAHLIALALWGGLVAAEAVVELASRGAPELEHAAKLHYWMDLLVELPLLAAVVTTGAVLTAHAAPLTALHWVKIVAGLAAVGANLYCVAHVVLRYRRIADGVAMKRHGDRVRLSAAIGVPFALVALFIGFGYFAR